MGIVGGIVIAAWAWNLLRDTAAVLLDTSDPHLEQEIRDEVERPGDARIFDLHVVARRPRCACCDRRLCRRSRARETVRQRLTAVHELQHVTVEARQRRTHISALRAMQRSGLAFAAWLINLTSSSPAKWRDVPIAARKKRLGRTCKDRSRRTPQRRPPAMKFSTANASSPVSPIVRRPSTRCCALLSRGSPMALRWCSAKNAVTYAELDRVAENVARNLIASGFQKGRAHRDAARQLPGVHLLRARRRPRRHDRRPAQYAATRARDRLCVAAVWGFSARL